MSRGTSSSSRQTTMKPIHSVSKTQSSQNKGTLRHIYPRLGILPFGCAWITPLSSPCVYTSCPVLLLCSLVRASVFASLPPHCFVSPPRFILPSFCFHRSTSFFLSASESQVKELSTESRLSGYSACEGSWVDPR